MARFFWGQFKPIQRDSNHGKSGDIWSEQSRAGQLFRETCLRGDPSHDGDRGTGESRTGGTGQGRESESRPPPCGSAAAEPSVGPAAAEPSVGPAAAEPSVGSAAAASSVGPAAGSSVGSAAAGSPVGPAAEPAGKKGRGGAFRYHYASPVRRGAAQEMSAQKLRLTGRTDSAL